MIDRTAICTVSDTVDSSVGFSPLVGFKCDNPNFAAEYNTERAQLHEHLQCQIYVYIGVREPPYPDKIKEPQGAV